MEKERVEALRDEQLEKAAGGDAGSMFAGLDVSQLIAGPMAQAEKAMQELAAQTEQFISDFMEEEHREVQTRTFSFCSGGMLRDHD